ncbi:TolC family protein [Flavobacterium sp. JP2137]|uniref:TolC family protein n=1 Tax=Flavobacterium sp. JP2137 TaxID=3414510 RepID=UPI003D2FCCED
MNMQVVAWTAFWCLTAATLQAQTLSLSDALEHSVLNFQKIKAKEAALDASKENVRFNKRSYLPDLTLSAQQSYGTINAQNGPMYSYGGLGSAASSMPLEEQNWNAAFGALYLANINWNFFSFGKIKSEIDGARSKEQVLADDLDQLRFQHQIKVGAAYFNLLAAQRIKYVQERNVERALVIEKVTESRSKSGLIPAVDFATAQAEVSYAQAARIKAIDKELAYSKSLAQLLGQEYQQYQLDDAYVLQTPTYIGESALSLEQHPVLEWQKSQVEHSQQQEKIHTALQRPSLSLFGVVQGRGSGFEWNYVQDNSAFSKAYTHGVGIDRTNYLVGLNLSWNLTQIFRQSSKAKEQKYLTQALEQEYLYAYEDIKAQRELTKEQWDNAVAIYEQTKIQVSAASKAYGQHTALYTNGLSSIVDVTQAFYLLHRAEIDSEIAQNNVWQALWMIAAATGDVDLLLNETNTQKK